MGRPQSGALQRPKIERLMPHSRDAFESAISLGAATENREGAWLEPFCKGRDRCVITISSYVTARDNIGIPESVIGGAGIGCLLRVALMEPIGQGLVKP